MFLFCAALVLSLFLFVNVSAVENTSEDSLLTSAPEKREGRMNFKEIEDKAGMVPGDTFYFLDRTFDVFQSSESLADERAYELAVLANESSVEGKEFKNRTMEKARERYEKAMQKRERKANRTEETAEKVANQSTKHLEVLSRVYEKAPKQVKGAIEKAMNNSMKGRQNAINSLRKFNESKSQQMRNQTSQRIQERVSEEVQNMVKNRTGIDIGSRMGQPEMRSGAGSDEEIQGGEKGQQGGETIGQSGEAYETFKSYLEENPEYNVKYEITHSDGSTEIVEIYTKNGETRIEGEDEEYILWVNGKSIVDYQGQCINLDDAQNYGIDPKSLYQQSPVKKGSIKSEDKYLEVSSAGTKNIAGKTTECFEFVYETEQYNQLTTYCVTDKGIPALVKTVNRDSGELQSESRATKLEDSVSDSVLEACEPDTEIPSF